jgi:alkylation response protein AidB-like acyl-CoA dehydrogenase
MTATDTNTALVEAARALAPQIRAFSDQMETGCRLPSPLVKAIADAGLFRMLVPKKLGGLEVDVATMIAAIEEVSKIDGSAGWCVMIGGTGGVISAYLREEVAHEIYGSNPQVVTGGTLAPHGKAIAVDGGYRVSGRWPFGSGCQHCNWLMGGCVICKNGKPGLLANKEPDSRMMIFPATDAQIIDTWSVSGLRGTGSHDFAVTNLFVPEKRSASLITDQPYQPGPTYAFPVFGLLAVGVTSVALGMARGAIDTLVELAGSKIPTGSRRRLSERSLVQMQIAQAEALLRSARSFLCETAGEVWKTAAAGDKIPIKQRALLRLAATHATTSSAQAIDLMYHAAGTSSIYASSPLQRYFRDIHVLTQHAVTAPPIYEMTGRLLLGLDTDTEML